MGVGEIGCWGDELAGTGTNNKHFDLEPLGTGTFTFQIPPGLQGTNRNTSDMEPERAETTINSNQLNKKREKTRRGIPAQCNIVTHPKTQLQMKQQAQHCIKHVHSHKTQCGVNVKIAFGFVKKSMTEQQFERMDIEEQKHSTCANRHSGLHGACSHQFELSNTRWADCHA